jgi:hypothetical protein
MKKKRLITYLGFNLVASVFITLLLILSDKYFTTGFLSYLDLLLSAPGFFLLSLLKGFAYSIHGASRDTFFFASYFAFSFIIGVFQLFYYFKKLNKKNSHLD